MRLHGTLPGECARYYGHWMRFLVLGPVEVTAADGPLPLEGPKQRAVLAHLILRANQVVSADALIDQIWGDEPPHAARNSLQSYISHLRKALGGDRLEGRAPGYVLHLAHDELDASVFEALVREARNVKGNADRASMLREALSLWRGPAYADLAGEESLRGEIARLEELRLQALEERLAADIAAGRHGDVVGELESLTREHPLREKLWEHFMLALYLSSRQADALSAFREVREMLADQLGVDPSPELQRLHERVLQQDPDLEIKGEPLRGYRLLEQIGSGAHGVVYRAIQPQVGREVAVKSILPALANQPNFVLRFEREAQLVARLEHPHIVPLYDYWREPDAAYLIMRFLRGGTLGDLAREGVLPLDRIVGILDQVAAALGAAHRQGIVHRDVKPGNVLMDEEGNAYLSDFGIAMVDDSLPQAGGATSHETQAYVSPEQLRSERPTPRSDIYSLGVVLFEMLTGEHPFFPSSLNPSVDRRPLPSAHEARPGLPAAIDAIIARATADDPGARFPDVDGLSAAFRDAIAAPPRVPALVGAIRNPYKGLRAFLEADAADFFGREALVGRLVERMAELGSGSRFLCVVGPSGSGKSSVVRAGLVPALRRGAIHGSDRWYVVDMAIGQHPLRDLESALLGIAVEPPSSLLEDLERDGFGLARAVDRVLSDPNAELLILMDQLEELFTIVDDADERGRLLELVRTAVEAPGSRIRVVATLRADFFDRPLSVHGFGELLAERTEALHPMWPEQFERAITGPAERVGLEVESGLVAVMVADVAAQPGALPLLQYALTELADQSANGLRLDGYREIGGISGALARRAEQLYGAMDVEGQNACQQLFLRLVSPGDGAEDTRRRVRSSELASLDVNRSRMDAVIQAFGRHRLLSFDTDEITREPTVEIAHEALIGAWTRLREWIVEAREDLRTHRRLLASADEWLASGGDPSFLLTGARLERLASWASQTPVALGRERQFVDESIERHEQEMRAEHARAAHERSLERRSARRRRAFVSVLAVASLVAASLTAIAVNRGRDAQLNAEREIVGRLTAGAVESLDTDPELSLLLALHAVDAAELDHIPAATVEALHWAIQEAGIAYPKEGPPTLVSGPLGTRGVFDMPIPQLVDLARDHVTRSLTPQECERYFASANCPSLPTTFASDVTAEPIRAIDSPIAEEPLAGTEVTLYDPGLYGAPWVTEFLHELRAFTASTGIKVQLVNTLEVFESGIRERVTEGDTPDLAFVPQPQDVAAFARQGRLIDLGAYLDVEGLQRDQSPYLVSLGTVGPEGEWPSDEGGTYGAFVELNVKSLIWYPAHEFDAAGYAIPATWAELVALSDRMVSEGRTPWCVGYAFGGDGSSDGWPGTDWIENLLLASAGPAAYDSWTFHGIPFDSHPIRKAFHRLGRILFTKGYVYGGRKTAARTLVVRAQRPMIRRDPPGCWLDQTPSFLEGWFPKRTLGRAFNVFPFPSMNEASLGPVLGGGSMLAAFADRPEVREFVKFLLSPAYGIEMAGSEHGFISPNRRFDLANYAPFDRQQAELARKALAMDTFRFDASDLMPAEVGQDVFWRSMMRYLAEGPSSLDRILTELDAAYPDS